MSKEMIHLEGAEMHPRGKAIFVKATLTEETTDISRERRIYFPASMARALVEMGEWSVPKWLAEAKAAEQVYLWVSSDGAKGIDHLHGACFTAEFSGRNFMVTHEAMERARDYLANGSRPKPPSVEVDLTAVREMLATAKANGVKFPRYRAQNLDITKAGDGSKDPGCLYVKTWSKDYYSSDFKYQGKITAEGRFFASHEARSDTVDNLKAIASDPVGSLMAYGISTGVCSCCGQWLTHPASIEKGIGPICARHYGLDVKNHYKMSNTPQPLDRCYRHLPRQPAE